MIVADFLSARAGRSWALALAGILAGAVLLLPPSVQAETRQIEWDYRSDQAMPECWNGVRAAVAREEKTPDGEAALEVESERGRDDLLWSSFLNYVTPASAFDDAKEVEVSFWAKGEAGTEFSLRVASERNLARPSPSQSFVLNGQWQKIRFRESLSAPLGGKWACAPRLALQKIRSGQRLYLGPVVLHIVP